MDKDTNKDSNIAYINSTRYSDLQLKIKELKDVIDDHQLKQSASRLLRYAEVDIEAERESGRFLPDELYIPMHVIDTNIKREQAPYVQYVSQSQRAVICSDLDDSGQDLALLEEDLTKKLRYDGWQLPLFSNIDNFQANGYGIMEVVYDPNQPGHVAHEMVQYGDFGFVTDTRDIQSVEMCGRAYYYTRTKLLALCGSGDRDDDFIREQVMKVIDSSPSQSNTSQDITYDNQRSSLYRIYKMMFRVEGMIYVAWCCPDLCDSWLRIPRKLFIGRKQQIQAPNGMSSIIQRQMVAQGGNPMQPQQPQAAQSQDAFETQFPYVVFPYLISENDTIAQLKGRVFLDQDQQEAITSLLSSTCTQARRASGLYFSKDVTDPNDEFLMEKNVFFKSSCIINSKITSFQLPPPNPSMFNAINTLYSLNQNETSQVNFAVNNRKDSRKTAKEVSTAEQQQQNLSTVQVVLFAISLKNMYTIMTDIIVSRVKAGVLKINNPQVAVLYNRRFQVKPSGDTDVIERQQKINMMLQSWPVYQNTPMAQAFLTVLTELMFPDEAARYQAAVTQSMQQQQSQGNQMIQQVLTMMKTMANGIHKLAKSPEYFSDSGRLHAFPIVEHFSDELDALEKQVNQNNPQQQKKVTHVTGQR